MSLTTADIALRLDGEVLGDGAALLTGFATAESAKSGDLTFAEKTDYFDAAEKSQATAILCGQQFSSARKTVIRVKNPRVAFARAMAFFVSEPKFATGIHPSSVIAASVQIDPTAHIGPHCTIGERVKIGAHCVLQAGDFIGDDAVLGEGTNLFSNVTVYARSQIGKRVCIHAGAVIDILRDPQSEVGLAVVIDIELKALPSLRADQILCCRRINYFGGGRNSS